MPTFASITAGFCLILLALGTPALADPHAGVFAAEGVKIELAGGADRYMVRLDVEGRRLRGMASGAGPVTGTLGEGDAAAAFTLTVQGDQATLQFGGRAFTLARGAVLGADAPPPPPTVAPVTQAPAPAVADAVVIPGAPPLRRSMIEAHTDLNEWLLQLLLDDPEVRFDAQQRTTLGQQLQGSWGSMTAEQKQFHDKLPAMWAEVRSTWGWLDAASRQQIGAGYRAQWLAQAQAQAARMQAAERAAQQQWLQAAEAKRRTDYAAAQRVLPPRGAPAGGRWTKADTQRHMRNSMANHFVQMNMHQMTFNSFRTGFATLSP